MVEDLRGVLKDTLLPQELTEREFVRHARAHYLPVWLEAPKEPAAVAWRTMCDQVLGFKCDSEVADIEERTSSIGRIEQEDVA